MTRAELISLFKSLIDEQGNEVFGATRINELLYEGAQQVQDLIEAQDENYFAVVEDISVTSDALQIALDSNMRILLLVEKIEEPVNIKFEYVTFRNLVDYRRLYGAGVQAIRPAYGLRNNTLIYPEAMGEDHMIRITRTDQLANLTADDQSWGDIPAIAHRLIAYEAAYIGLVSEDSDARQFSDLLFTLRARIVQGLDQRVRTEPRSVNYKYECGGY